MGMGMGMEMPDESPPSLRHFNSEFPFPFLFLILFFSDRKETFLRGYIAAREQRPVNGSFPPSVFLLWN